MCKRNGPDTQPTVVTLCSQVKEPNINDADKLTRLALHANGTKNVKLTLEADGTNAVK